jgi:hypothetical protein
MFLELHSIYGKPVYINISHIISIMNMPEIIAKELPDKPQLEYTSIRTAIAEYRVFETAEYIMEQIQCINRKLPQH